jgi:hypothetical protein
MSNSLYNRIYSAIAGSKVRSKELRDEFSRLATAFDILGPCALRIDNGASYAPTQDQVLSFTAVQRASKTLGFDASGNITIQSGLVASFGGEAISTVDLLTGLSIPSAATINLTGATGNRVHITGTTAITAVTLAKGPRTVIFDGVLTLTHHATNNKLPGGVNITTAAGDIATYESDGTVVYCTSYVRADGTPVTRSIGGSATGSGSVTLTSASSLVQQRTFTALGQGFTMPDATTLANGVMYALFNNSEYPAFVKDSTGVKRCFIAPMTGVMISLASNATAAGTWTYSGHQLFGVTAGVEVAIGTALINTTLTMQAVPLSSTLTVILFGSTATTGVYGIAYDTTTGWGAVTLIDSLANTFAFIGQAVSATSLAVFAANTGGANRLRGTGVTVTGTTVAAGASTTLATAGAVVLHSAALVTSTACIAYSDGTAGKIVGATLSGVALTFGAAVTPSAAASGSTTLIQLYASGVTLVAIVPTTTPSIICLPYAVSGTTLTVGTSATTATMDSATTMRTLAISSTGWFSMAVLAGSTLVRGYYWTLSGTTITLSSVVAQGSVGYLPSTQSDAAVVNGKLLIAFTDATNAHLQIISFSGSVATAGTALSFSTGLPTGWAAGAPIVSVSGSTARVIVTGTAAVRSLTVDCSGASPTVTQRHLLGAQDLSLPTLSSPMRGKRAAATLTNASALTAALPIWVSGAYDKRNTMLAITPLREWPLMQDMSLVGTISDVGNSATECWLAADVAAAQGGANALYLQKVEMATP